MWYLLALTFGFLLNECLINADTSEQYVLKTKSLPEDRNFMPSLGNGHLGYTVFGDSIFMVGVYSGGMSNSAPARMPNWINITATICDKFECMTDEDISEDGTTYEMDLKDGYFRYQQNYTKLGVTLEQRSYAHRYYTRALVYEVVAKRTGIVPDTIYGARSTSPMYLKLQQFPGAKSDAFTFKLINNGTTPGEYRTLHGRTEAVEFERFQDDMRDVYIVFSENFDEEEVIVDWPAWLSELRYQVIVTADISESVALKEMQDLQKLTHAAVLQSHIDGWLDFYNKYFLIEIDGDMDLWRIANAGIFYIACSLPLLATNQPNLPFYGVSATGLARGNLDAEFNGHIGLDAELWLLPMLAHFSHSYAELLCDYRKRLLAGAKYNAFSRGFQGARFPWHSAFTGIEVSKNASLATQAIHISADVVYGLEKYYSINKHTNFICDTAWPIVHDVADFYISRVACWDLFKICYIFSVIGPDQSHANVNDNVYTNAAAKKALEFAIFAGEKCGNESHKEKIANWRSIAEQIYINYDADLDYHPQYTGYREGSNVRQADVVLLGYPLHFNMKISTRRNDLKWYANITSDEAPPTTWFMYAINYLQIYDDNQAHKYFKRGYEKYVHSDFLVWSNKPIGANGAANYLPGPGALLQTLLSGYGGVDYERNGEQSVEMNRAATMPPNVERVSMKYIRHGLSNCRFTYAPKTKRMNCIDV